MKRLVIFDRNMQYIGLYFICFTIVDDTRVVLEKVEDEEGSDYVNANYIDVSSKLIMFWILHVLHTVNLYLFVCIIYLVAQN